VKNTRSRLIPYLKDSKIRRHRAFSKKENLVINGKIHGLDWLLNKENSCVGYPCRANVGLFE
jgi:hypothetical protein